MTRDSQVYETIVVEEPAPGVVLITLSRPGDANGVVPSMIRELMSAFEVVERDHRIKVAVITGAGRQFSAGADLNALSRYLAERHEIEREPYNVRILAPLTIKVTNLRLPVIAAINGGATAGGLDLALACDIRLASTSAKFGETYINIGCPPANGGMYFLPRLVGSGVAAEMAFTGEVIDAERALAIGLVNHVVEPDQLLPRSIELASRIAKKPWRVLEATKQALRAGWHVDLTTFMNQTYWSVAALSNGPDIREGVAAFLEKRTPVFDDHEPESNHWD